MTISPPLDAGLVLDPKLPCWRGLCVLVLEEVRTDC